MDDWTKFKKRIKTTNPELAEDLKEVEDISTKLVNKIKQRQHHDLSNMDLAKLCDIPHSAFDEIN